MNALLFNETRVFGINYIQMLWNYTVNIHEKPVLKCDFVTY